MPTKEHIGQVCPFRGVSILTIIIVLVLIQITIIMIIIIIIIIIIITVALEPAVKGKVIVVVI